MKNPYKNKMNKYRVNKSHKPRPRLHLKCVSKLEIEYIDEGVKPGEKTYYRLMDSKKHLTSNPIFVEYSHSSPGFLICDS